MKHLKLLNNISRMLENVMNETNMTTKINIHILTDTNKSIEILIIPMSLYQIQNASIIIMKHYRLISILVSYSEIILINAISLN